MKNYLGILILLLITTVVLTSFRSQNEVYPLDRGESIINWKLPNSHENESGTVQFQSGTIAMNNGNLANLEFRIDMSSLEVKTPDNVKKQGKIKDKLSDEKNFNSGEYDQIQFKLSKVERQPSPDREKFKYKLTGRMNIKGHWDDVSFPATVTHIGQEITFRGTMMLNPGTWNMKDEVSMELLIVGK